MTPLPDAPPELEFLTVSYRGDFERFRFLRRTVLEYSKEVIPHVVAVPRRDLELFKTLLPHDPALRIVAKNDYLPRKYYPKWWFDFICGIAPFASWRLRRHAGRPGWIRQQVVKLSAADISPAETIVAVDSDTIFIRPFGVSDFKTEKDAYLVKEQPSIHRQHLINARKLLKLPNDVHGHGYMGSPFIFNREWLISLLMHLQTIYDNNWKEVLYENQHYSEYTLYGVYVDEYLGPKNLKYHEPYQEGVWLREEFRSTGELIQLIGSRIDDARSKGKLAVVIQSHLGHSVSTYEDAVLKKLNLPHEQFSR